MSLLAKMDGEKALSNEATVCNKNLWVRQIVGALILTILTSCVPKQQGEIVEKIYEPSRTIKTPNVMFNGIKSILFGTNTPVSESFLIKINNQGKYQIVAVKKEVFEKLKIGDKVRVENNTISVTAETK